MTTERASALRCIQVGAFSACIWASALAGVLWLGQSHFQDVDDIVGAILLIGSLAVVAVGIPAWRDERFRNPASVFFLSLSAVAVSALLATLAGAAFLLWLFLGSSSGMHR